MLKRRHEHKHEREPEPEQYVEKHLLQEEDKEDDTTEENIERKKKLIRQIKCDLIIKIAGFAIVLFVTFTFIFGITLAPTNDMFPAIHEGDMLIYFRLGRLDNKEIALYETEDGMNLGRVQAVQGERIDRTEGNQLTINGNIQPIQERSGLYYETYVDPDSRLRTPSAVPEESYLILGDERLYATDSRAYGYIQRDKVKGKIFTIIRRRPL